MVAGVAAMSAFEAHVINVTAHIENALKVETTPIQFGTVFPQEYLTKDFKISLSDSFIGASTADDVSYVIAQKPKPILPKPATCAQGYTTEEAARAYCIATPSDTSCCYLSLCPFLSKTSPDTNDTSEPSYYIPAVIGGASAYCQTPATSAAGYLSKNAGDTDDVWTVDLKVPPVAGYVGQDWPASCANWVVAQNAQDYGCDLWVEVTGISRLP